MGLELGDEEGGNVERMGRIVISRLHLSTVEPEFQAQH